MESFLIAVVSMAVVLGIMILVHEFGHYAAAKYFGVRVDVFSIGFGKRLAASSAAIPTIASAPCPWRIRQDGGRESAGIAHRRGRRIHVASALAALCDRHRRPGNEHPAGHRSSHRRLHGALRAAQFFDQPAVVGWVLDNSPAAKAGIEQGDRIVRIDGTQNPTWEDVLLKVMISPKQPVDVAIQRGIHPGKAGEARVPRARHDTAAWAGSLSRPSPSPS